MRLYIKLEVKTGTMGVRVWRSNMANLIYVANTSLDERTFDAEAIRQLKEAVEHNILIGGF
jgi:hypothetical protein